MNNDVEVNVVDLEQFFGSDRSSRSHNLRPSLTFKLVLSSQLYLFRSEINQKSIRALIKQSENSQRALREHL